MIKITSFWLLLIVFLNTDAYAAKLYKIVDKNGKVTYSQYPPSEKKLVEKMETVTMKGSKGPMAAVTDIGNSQYCGNIKLPQQRIGTYANKNYFNDIARSIKRWKSSLTRVEESVARNTHNQYKRNKNRMNSNSYTSRQDMHHRKSQENNNNQARDLRCAIQWAESQQGDIDNFQETNSEELKRLRAIYADTNNKMERECGPKPKLDPNDRVLNAQLNAWKKCSKNYKNDIRKIERAMRAVASNIRNLK